MKTSVEDIERTIYSLASSAFLWLSIDYLTRLGGGPRGGFSPTAWRIQNSARELLAHTKLSGPWDEQLFVLNLLQIVSTPACLMTDCALMYGLADASVPGL